MDDYLRLSAQERKLVCLQAESHMPELRAPLIEKDFWVCWTLHILFESDHTGGTLTFKGGTSLSKGYGLIRRFSEDIDIVIGRHVLGFDGVDAPEAAPSRNKMKQRLDALMEACRSYVHGPVAATLSHAIGNAHREGERWSLKPDENDSDGLTLLLEYPTVFDRHPAVAPVVRIELGARSDTEPGDSRAIVPYLQNVLPKVIRSDVRTVHPRRTFWEKVMLLHEATHGGSGRSPAARLSRHYYDVWCLWNSEIGRLALHDDALFDRVATHRKLYFQRNAAAQEALKKGAIHLLPHEQDMAEWKRDYAGMRDMFFDDPPSFDALLHAAKEIQDACNHV